MKPLRSPVLLCAMGQRAQSGPLSHYSTKLLQWRAALYARVEGGFGQPAESKCFLICLSYLPATPTPPSRLSNSNSSLDLHLLRPKKSQNEGRSEKGGI